jgi:drug/metabolite transporter (DMT)-like permease
MEKEHYTGGKEEWLPGHSLRSSRKNKMSIEKDNINPAILIVLIAGILWSFGALTVRFIEDAHLVPWQYLFFRGCTIFLLLNIYLFLKKENHLLRIIKNWIIGNYWRN